MHATMRLTGGAQLEQRLRELPASVSGTVLRKILRRAAEPVRARMSEMAPHRPGPPDLRDRIVISGAGGDDDFDMGDIAVAIGPSKSAFWGYFQEFGTSRQAARPFARPAFDASHQAALTEIGEGIWAALRQLSPGRASSTAGGRFA